MCLDPFYVHDKGWIAAQRLVIGDQIELQSGEDAYVDAVEHEKLTVPIQVYNFEVEEFHTYYVGGACVLVHNMCQTSDHAIAKRLGYTKTKEISHGQSVFVNKKANQALRYITRDVDSHNGGFWKAASSVRNLARRATRSGTYNMLLTRKIGP